MPNEEVLGPRKTMIILVIVVGCFAVLWPKILSPLLLGHTREQLKPNKFDREAGCCEVMFGAELAVLELINEVCNSAAHLQGGKLSPKDTLECRKAVNETCGVDIAAFLKRTENIGKSSKILVETMKNSNTSCLKENFGVPVLSWSSHQALNSWTMPDTLKQERPSIRGSGPHPALRERGRAIPPGAAPPAKMVTMPPHVRVRSPLSVYYELDIKPPPIPGMRPPLGSPGGPVTAPKSSMGFIMPIYTICIVVFFVYTLSKIFFKRASTPYEPVRPDPQFRRRVFRDDSRTTPDKLVVTAISGLVAEVQQQMESNGVSQQRQAADNHTRSFTNGTVLHDTGPVHIVTSEYRNDVKNDVKEKLEPKEPSPPPQDSGSESKEISPEPEDLVEGTDESSEEKETNLKESHDKDVRDLVEDVKEEKENIGKEFETEPEIENKQLSEKLDDIIEVPVDVEDKLIKLTGNGDAIKDVPVAELIENFVHEESKTDDVLTQNLLEDAAKEDNSEEEQENASVKVVGMELTAHAADGGAWHRTSPPVAPAPSPAPPSQARPHEAEEVKSIFLETEIPQKSRVLVADFGEDRPDPPAPAGHTPMVVSGKMTLSLIQDAPKEGPEVDPESTVDDFTTASAVTQPAAEKGAIIESDEEEIDEEIEVEEIEEEIEEEEIEEDQEEENKGKQEVNKETSVEKEEDVEVISKDEDGKVDKLTEDREEKESIGSLEDDVDIQAILLKYKDEEIDTKDEDKLTENKQEEKESVDEAVIPKDSDGKIESKDENVLMEDKEVEEDEKESADVEVDQDEFKRDAKEPVKKDEDTTTNDGSKRVNAKEGGTAEQE